ncbi:MULTISPECIES: cell division protein FtsX [unclassified Sphingomonas]|uniref:cell division protein FtsX n=1 Tax=unclassified Sphingomonas TaxID=196159 RepID=UPI0006F86016|nr:MULTISPECIES: FtsX-like permease family protein [unclassified Sphingomonas]KQX25522.1 cell division protein [Sphingomonas sp. Root1294]KQY66512.1 cell division protein [Sphingomonas sp. Root50]KRB90166.1 cell division protein [Sphingomonas sp. Root720]
MPLFGRGSGNWLTSAAGRRLLPEGWLSGPMPWVIAIMMFLMVLAAASGLALGFAARGLDSHLSGQITVQIVDANQARRDATADRVVGAVGRLPGVAIVRRISDREMTELLRPWLGAGLADNDLPVPAMIDVSFAPGAADAQRAAEAAVLAISPRARIDDHAQWLAPLAGLIASLRWLAAVLVLLMAAAAAFTVVLAARSALNTHQATIEVMHHLGSTDAQIAQLFQRRIATDALFGGMVGLLLASLVIFAVGDRIAKVGSDLIGSVDLPLAAWGVLALLPLAGTLLAMVAARMTIILALRRRL